MRIVDVHLHVWPVLCGTRQGNVATRADRYGKVRRVGQRVERWLPPSFVDTTVSPEVALEYMSIAGVDKGVLIQAPCYGDNNEYISEVVKAYPDKFVGVAITDPRKDDKGIGALETAICGLGLSAVKFELPDWPFRPDEEQYDVLWKRILELDIPVILDLGWGQTEYDFQLDAVRRLLMKFPELKMVIAHLGVSQLWDPKQDEPFPVMQQTLELANIGSNVMFELAGLPGLVSEQEYPYPRAQRAIKAAYEAVGGQKIMWGSDFPSILLSCTYQQTVDLVRRNCASFIPESDMALILGGNAERCFGF
jgi:predicted TIM-barrel fold metal-dependent hydrolase